MNIVMSTYYIFYRKKLRKKKLEFVGPGSTIPGSGSANPDQGPHQDRFQNTGAMYGFRSIELVWYKSISF